jgi:predicted ABC-type ATPase
VADPDRTSCIYVLAGTNGAGKSSIGGEIFRRKHAEYFNPDEAARRIQDANSDANIGLTISQANEIAWRQGKRLLERAIAERLDFAFETTLGGQTITGLLEEALLAGIEVRIWFAGLSSPELHIARVRTRVKRGGHDIPEKTIRERYDKSRLNLIRLLPNLTELRLYDNSREADPKTHKHPEPLLLLHLVKGKIKTLYDPALIPDWAKPIVAAAMKPK